MEIGKLQCTESIRRGRSTDLEIDGVEAVPEVSALVPRRRFGLDLAHRVGCAGRRHVAARPRTAPSATATDARPRLGVAQQGCALPSASSRAATSTLVTWPWPVQAIPRSSTGPAAITGAGAGPGDQRLDVHPGDGTAGTASAAPGGTGVRGIR